MVPMRQLLLVAAMLVSSAWAFQPTPTSARTNSRWSLAANPNLAVTPGENDQGVTPNQIIELRKEASKRKARKALVQQNYVADEGDNEEQIQEFYSTVCETLEHHEMCELRGVSIQDKRIVYETASQLAYDLSVQLQRDVAVVQVKGHAATLYCPSSDPSKRKIVLRTSYKEGVWSKREKAPRDYRGQIVQN